MNPEWVRETLTEYLEHIRLYNYGQRDELEWVVAHQHIVGELVGDLVDGIMWPVMGGSYFPAVYPTTQEQFVQAALVALDAQAEGYRSGSGAGVWVRIDELHPWVWDSAKSLWESGHGGEAIDGVAKVINARLQKRVGRRDLANTQLVRETFSLKPPVEGRPRLRVREDDGSDSFKSAQEGAMHLGEAVFMLWRNIHSHEVDEVGETEVFEALSAMSAFARLIEISDLVEAPSDEK